MSPTPGTDARPRPVERFAPTSGQFLGWTGILIAAVAVGYPILAVHTVTGLRVALGAVVFAVVVWMTQLRPRATAYPRHLVLRNSVRDTHIPLHEVDEVAVRQSLQVFVGDQRHVCIGVGRSSRDRLKQLRRRSQQTVGASRFQEFKGKAEVAGLDERAVSYATFVETRIQELVEQARKERRDAERRRGPPHLGVARGDGAAGVVGGVRGQPAGLETGGGRQVPAHRVEAARGLDPRRGDGVLAGVAAGLLHRHHDLEVALELRLGAGRAHDHPGAARPAGSAARRSAAGPACPRRGPRPSRRRGRPAWSAAARAAGPSRRRSGTGR